MTTIIVFFRDTLSGILYIVVSVVCFVLICICIWQLIVRNKKTKAAEEKFASSHVVIINSKGEEETLEIAPSTVVTQNVSVPSSKLPSATAGSTYNTSVSSAVFDITGQSAKASNNKAVVMINPLEVAAVSSTMNIIGATSAQKASFGTQNNLNQGTVIGQSNTSGVAVSSQNTISTLSAVMPSTSGSGADVEQQSNEQNFTN